MRRVILIVIGFMIIHSEQLFAQNVSFGLKYSTNADYSSNGMNENIVEYSSNKRIEVSFIYKSLYSHISWESLSFSENSIVYNSNTNSVSYANNPFNTYDLAYLNIGLGWQAQPKKWIRFISGLSLGALVSSSVSQNRNLIGSGIAVDPLNNKNDKEEAINKLRLNVFQSIEVMYEVWDSWNIVLGYKFEVPLVPLVSNYDASSNFTLNNHASERFLQMLSIGIRYRLK